MRITLAILSLAWALPALAQTPKVPVNPNKPPNGYRRYGGGRHPHTYVFPGVLTQRTSHSFEVTSEGGELRKFVINQDSKIPATLKPGARVVVDYDSTLDANVFKVMGVTEVRAGKPFPKAKGPQLPPP